jgi:hypothetical protein
MADLRSEQKQLKVSIEELTRKGGYLKVSHCGKENRLCVLVDAAADSFDDSNHDEAYMVATGYRLRFE